MIFALFIPISYIYLAFKFPAARKNIAIMFVGFATFCVGVLIVFTTFVGMFPTVSHELKLISAVIQILGFSIFAIGIKRMYFGA